MASCVALGVTHCEAAKRFPEVTASMDNEEIEERVKAVLTPEFEAELKALYASAHAAENAAGLTVATSPMLLDASKTHPARTDRLLSRFPVGIFCAKEGSLRTK